MINDYWQFVHAHLPILEGVAHLIENYLFFDRIDRDKGLSRKQLKNFKIGRFWCADTHAFD